MKHLDLTLRPLSLPQLDSGLLAVPVKVLHEVSEKNIARFGQGNESKKFKNRKEELIKSIKLRPDKGKSFQDVTNVFGRQRLLLSIYIEHFGRLYTDWLPPFSDSIAASVLGINGNSWHMGRKRQATLLFFTHFNNLEALSFLCHRLKEAYSYQRTLESSDNNIQIWYRERNLIFSPIGHVNVAEKANPSDTLTNLMQRYAIPEQGKFAEKLRQIYLLKKIEKIPVGSIVPVFREIEQSKEELTSENISLGASALKIMVQRIIKENNGIWKGKWPSWITRFGCDPRYGRDSSEGAKWWGWATDNELRVALRAMNKLNLRFFINFLKNSLEGTANQYQFELRAKFLWRLYESRKIISVRLALNKKDYQRLDIQYRSRHSVAQLIGAPAKTSMICLQCIDNIYIVEGTHTFGLRAYHRYFPLRGFWEFPQHSYQDSQLRTSPFDCPIFIRHVQSGKWVDKFFDEIRIKFHVEWANVVR